VRDTGEIRIEKILRLVRESKFGIHDISRTTLDPATRLPRFNMPLELGLFLGAREFGDRRQREKVTLVLERDKYSYLKFCSDISGQDPEAHNGEPFEAVTIVRNWLRTHSDFGMPSAEQTLRRFTRFRRQLPAMCHRPDNENGFAFKFLERLHEALHVDGAKLMERNGTHATPESGITDATGTHGRQLSSARR
jgi:hypothetical protein